MNLENRTTEIKWLCKTMRTNFIKIGQRLKEIRDQKIYLERYPTFTEYLVSADFLFSRSYAYKLIEIHDKFPNVSRLDTIPLNKLLDYARVEDQEEREALIDEAINKPLRPTEKPVKLENLQKEVKRFTQRMDQDLETETDSGEAKLCRQINFLLTELEKIKVTLQEMDFNITKAIGYSAKYNSEKVIGLRDTLKDRWESLLS